MFEDDFPFCKVGYVSFFPGEYVPVTWIDPRGIRIQQLLQTLHHSSDTLRRTLAKQKELWPPVQTTEGERLGLVFGVGPNSWFFV